MLIFYLLTYLFILPIALTLEAQHYVRVLTNRLLSHDLAEPEDKGEIL